MREDLLRHRGTDGVSELRCVKRSEGAGDSVSTGGWGPGDATNSVDQGMRITKTGRVRAWGGGREKWKFWVTSDTGSFRRVLEGSGASVSHVSDGSV